MISLVAGRPVRTVVCLGAHPDDIEIGCAGTLLRLAPEATEVLFVITSGDDRRKREAEESAHRLLGDHCAVRVQVGELADGFVAYDASRAKSFLRDSVTGVTPDVVFAPSRHDLHQDHRFVAEVALQVLRDHLILEYEIPKYDGDLVPPNLYVPLSTELLRAKVDHLRGSFESQHDKPWYRPEVFQSLATIRGIECHAEDGAAEGFHARKVVLG